MPARTSQVNEKNVDRKCPPIFAVRRAGKEQARSSDALRGSDAATGIGGGGTFGLAGGGGGPGRC